MLKLVRGSIKGCFFLSLSLSLQFGYAAAAGHGVTSYRRSVCGVMSIRLSTGPWGLAVS